MSLLEMSGMSCLPKFEPLEGALLDRWTGAKAQKVR